MPNGTNHDWLDFLKYAISHVEQRIQLIDNKAGLLMGIQGGFFVLVMFTFKELFSKGDKGSLGAGVYVAILIAFVSAVWAIMLLVMTIKPVKKFCDLEVKVEEGDCENYVMWKRHGFPESADEYRERLEVVKAGAPLEVEKNYEEVYFVKLQIIKRKYRYYNRAIKVMRISILGNSLVLVGAIVYKLGAVGWLAGTCLGKVLCGG